jgi:hypothetical protein
MIRHVGWVWVLTFHSRFSLVTYGTFSATRLLWRRSHGVTARMSRQSRQLCGSDCRCMQVGTVFTWSSPSLHPGLQHNVTSSPRQADPKSKMWSNEQAPCIGCLTIMSVCTIILRAGGLTFQAMVIRCSSLLRAEISNHFCLFKSHHLSNLQGPLCNLALSFLRCRLLLLKAGNCVFIVIFWLIAERMTKRRYMNSFLWAIAASSVINSQFTWCGKLTWGVSFKAHLHSSLVLSKFDED